VESSVQDVRGTETTVRLAAAGDEIAFARLIARHGDAMRRVAFVIAGDWALAEDAVQAAWTIAWRKLGSVRDEGRVEPWLVSIAANETRRLLRSRRRRTIVEMAATTDAAFGRDPADAIDLVDLTNALRRLSTDERSLIAMRFVAGLDSTEIGEVTGMSASGVRTRLARLLERLRSELGCG
jgi:RNA polymerase sigma-70 factor (ECF subfamily)